MSTRIDQKITACKVLSDDEPTTTEAGSNIVQMHESIERPELLVGSTYKIKTPMEEHAIYVTINDMVLNQDTEHEHRRPFEVFINSKNMEHFQWVVALTRLISAVFRKGGDATFLVDELKAVFDPKGGYFKKGGVFMPSLVAEIGCAIEDHMKRIGLINRELDEHQKAFLAEKRRELEAVSASDSEGDEGSYPANAGLCQKCFTKALVQMDGCMVCLSCGDSKCG